VFYNRNSECNRFVIQASFKYKFYEDRKQLLNFKTKVMRRLSYFAVLIMVLFLSTSIANATGVRAALENFTITSVDDLHLGKQVKAVWKISYSKDEVPVTVVKRKTLEGTEYLVQSEYFAVCYASTRDGFGAKQVRSNWCSVPKKINKAVINQQELAKQQIITPNSVDDKTALGLIASYLPDLINDGYTHILN